MRIIHKLRLTILFLIVPFIAYSQNKEKIEIIPQLGHLDEITHQIASPSGNFHATCGLDLLIVVKDVKTDFDLFRFYGHQSKITCMEFSPDEKYLFSGNENGVVKVWDLSKGEEVYSNRGKMGYTSRKWAMGIVGLFLTRKNKSSRFFDSVYSISIDPQMRFFAVNSVTGLRLYNYRNFELFGAITLNEWGPTENVFFDEEGFLNYSETEFKFEYLKTQKHFRIDCEKHIKYLMRKRELKNSDSTSIKSEFVPKDLLHGELSFKNDSELIFSNNYLSFALNLKKLETKVFYESKNKILTSEYDEKSTLFSALFEDHTLQIFEYTDNLNELKEIRDQENINDFEFVDQSDCLLFFTDRNLCEYELKEGKISCSSFYDVIPAYYRFNSAKRISSVKSMSRPNGLTYFIGSNNGIVIWEKGKNRIKRRYTGKPLYYNQAFSKINVGGWGKEFRITSLEIVNDGKYLISGAEDGSLRSLSIPKYKKMNYVNGHDSKVSDIIFVNELEAVISSSEDGSLRRWNFLDSSKTNLIGFQYSGIVDLVYNEKMKILASLAKDGSIKIWKIKSGDIKEIAQIFFHDVNKFSIVAPDGYYFNSQDYFKTYLFRVNNLIFPPEQFDLKLNRPDVILSRLGLGSDTLINIYELAYRKRLEKMNIKEELLSANFNAPELVVRNKNIPDSVSMDEISIPFQTLDSLELLDRINVFVNDVPIYGVAGIDLKPFNLNKYEDTIHLTLSQGKNKIQFSVINQGGNESLKQTFYVTYSPLTRKKPNLHFIAFGVGEYLDESKRLNYPKKDVYDLRRVFNSQNGFYEKQNIYNYVDGQFNLDTIVMLKSKLMQTSVDDVVIVFYAGHGLLDTQYEYYLATHNVNFQNPVEDGIPYEELESLLDGIPARQKLLLIDACHSGEIDTEYLEKVEVVNKQNLVDRWRVPGDSTFVYSKVGMENSFELMRELFVDLRRRTGATVISAAKGVELALESSKLENGAFTFALKEGLNSNKGKPNQKLADADNDGRVTLSELQKYLFRRVPELTNGLQQPTSRVLNISNDFQIW